MHGIAARRWLTAIFTTLLVGVGGAQAPPPPPDTPAARQLARWIETFNAGSREAWQRLIAEAFPPSAAPAVDPNLAFRDQTGGFDLVRFEQTSATEAIAIVKERDAESVGARIVVDVEPGEPHRIVGVKIQAGVRLPVTIPRLTDAQLPDAIRTEVQKRAAADRFSGAVLVAKDGTPIFAGAYGLADRERGIPNTVDTRFRNGSMNKMFTAVAVMTLVEAGTVQLDDPFGKYLTDYPNQALAMKVTVHQLLTHTGGTGDFFGPEFAANRVTLSTHADYLKRFGARGGEFEPGSRFEYSNYGYVILGALIEAVSGESYYDYVRDHVYKPAGMTSTGSEPEDAVVANRSVGYMKRPGTTGWQPNSPTLPYRGTAAGGGYTTVGDLLRFATALKNNRLLNQRDTDVLTTGKVDAMGGRYAYGLIERIVNGVRSIGHGGNAPGMDGDLEIYPDSGYVVAVLANVDPPAAQRVSEFIANRLPASSSTRPSARDARASRRAAGS